MIHGGPGGPELCVIASCSVILYPVKRGITLYRMKWFRKILYMLQGIVLSVIWFSWIACITIVSVKYHIILYIYIYKCVCVCLLLSSLLWNVRRFGKLSEYRDQCHIPVHCTHRRLSVTSTCRDWLVLQILQKGFVLDICNISSYAYISICLWGLWAGSCILYSAWINLMQELCTSLMISRMCGSSGSGCVNQLGMLSRQSLVRQAQNIRMASSHSKISKSNTYFICSFLFLYHTAMKSWALFDGSLQIAITCFIAIGYFSYFQTENPLPPLAERGLHRAILPHQPGAPGDRTLLIGMCKVPSKCVLFHTCSTHQMCIKYIKSSRPTYKYVQDVSLDVSMYRCIKVVPRPSEAFESSW